MSDIEKTQVVPMAIDIVARFDPIFRASPQGCMITGIANKIVYVNPAFESTTGYSAAESIGQTPSILHSGRQSPDYYQVLWQSLWIQGWWQGEIWNRRKDGEIYPEWLCVSRIYDERGADGMYLGIFSDISQRKQYEESLNFRVAHDFLTGLANRAQLQRHLATAITAARNHHRVIAVLYIDLDHFKPVNDRHGHEQGDVLLKLVAKRLQASVRSTDFTARVGGDEFVVVLDPLRSREDAAKIADQILVALKALYQLGSTCVHIDSSIGISIFPDNGESIDELLKASDSAMYLAKQAGGGRLAFA